MGLFSALKTVAGAVLKSDGVLDKVDEFVNTVPDKINQVKDITDKTTKMYKDYERNQTKKTINELKDQFKQLAKMNAEWDGRDFEEAIKIVDNKKLPISYAIPPQYDDMIHMGNNLFAVSLNEKWGVIDVNKQMIIPFEYDHIFAQYCDGSDDFIFPVQRGEKYGFINLKNETVLDFTYEDAGYFCNGIAPVAVLTEDGEDYMYGYIDMSGNFVIPPEFDDARPFTTSGCATVGLYNTTSHKIMFGVIDRNGGIILNCRYDRIVYDKEYIIGMHDISGSDFYDFNGIPLTPTEEMIENEEAIRDEDDMMGIAIVCKRSKKIKNKIIPYFNSELKCGYYIQDDEGSFCKIEPTFEEAYVPNDFGYARVKYRGLYGVINLNE